ncbi:retrovirus-related pol polyprotein from transposon TNT 1-94 [Tanacetum coccineum]
MSTQQDIYAAGSENRPPMLNKENYVPWSSRLLRQMQMVGGNGGNQFRQYAGQNVGYQNGYNAVQNVRNQVVQDAVQKHGVSENWCYNCRGLGYLARNCTVRPRRKDAAYLQTQLLIAQKEEAAYQLQAEELIDGCCSNLE